MIENHKNRTFAQKFPSNIQNSFQIFNFSNIFEISKGIEYTNFCIFTPIFINQNFCIFTPIFINQNFCIFTPIFYTTNFFTFVLHLFTEKFLHFYTNFFLHENFCIFTPIFLHTKSVYPCFTPKVLLCLHQFFHTDIFVPETEHPNDSAKNDA